MTEEIKKDKSTEENTNEEQVTLSEKELNKRIESESDKKLESALKKRDEQYKSDLDNAVKEALNEHKRLSELSDKERKEEEMTSREKQLAEREERIKLSEVKADAIDELSKRKVDTRFVDYLLSSDADETFENIKSFNELLDTVINDAVKASTRQDAPQRGGSQLTNKDKQTTDIVEMARQKRIIK